MESLIILFFMMLLGFIFLIYFAAIVLTLVCNWKLFEEANEEGWKALIPFYNTYISCGIVGLNKNWVWIMVINALVSIAFSVIPIIGTLLSVITMSINIYFAIILNISKARAFSKSDEFSIGLILLPVVFLPILAFGKHKYIGSSKPCKDPFMDFINKNILKKN